MLMNFNLTIQYAKRWLSLTPNVKDVKVDAYLTKQYVDVIACDKFISDFY